MAHNHLEGYKEDCLECIKQIAYAPYMQKNDADFDDSKYINKYVRSNEPIAIYKNPGEAAWRIAKPNTFIGRTVGFNAKKNWLKLSDGQWILFNPDYIYTPASGNKPEKGVLQTVTEKVLQSAAPGLNTASSVTAGIAVDQKAEKIAEAIDNVIPDLSTIKWVFIGLAVIIVLYLVSKIAK